VQEDGSIFTVVRPGRSASEEDICYNVDVTNYTSDWVSV
jgi:hypothetical protein